MSEMIPAALMLSGLLLILGKGELDTRSRTVLLAAALFGGAVGLKLTNLPFCIALTVALAIVGAGPFVVWMRVLAVLGVGMALGAAITAGPWWVYLYLKFGNPIFPYYNHIFRSPFYEFVRLTDDKFQPATALQAAFYPLFWAFQRSRVVTEPAMRDPRFALALLTALLMLLHSIATRRLPRVREWFRVEPPGTRERFLLIFFVVSFGVWEWMFSIFRYLAPIEMISGLIILLPALALLRTGRTGLAAIIAVGVILVTGTVTRYPAWGRMPYVEKSIQVSLPDLGRSGLVVLLDQSPLAYIATFAPATVRFVGVNNGLIVPGQQNLLARRIAAMIADATGPVWGLETLEPGKPPLADQSLAYFRLQRDGCTLLMSNAEEQPIQLCRLVAQARTYEARRYSTSFATAESPISEGGVWRHATSAWKQVQIIGDGSAGNPRRAVGRDNTGYDDAYAYLRGFAPDQAAEATIWIDPTLPAGEIHEVELHLRWKDASGNKDDARGYELCLAYDGAYYGITRWNGPYEDFTYLAQGYKLTPAPKSGDTLRGTATGDFISFYIDRHDGAGFVLLSSAVDKGDGGGPWMDGNPGMGFCQSGNPGGPGGDRFGFTSFNATGAAVRRYSADAEHLDL